MSVVIGGAPTPAASGSRRRSTGCLVGVGLFTLVMVLPFVAVLIAVWPGVLKLTAPVVCPDGYGDTVIARDTYNPRPGETSTTFTMYCLNERGELSEEGAFLPGAIVTVVLMAAVLVLMVLLVAVLGVRARRRRAEAGSTVDLSTIGGATGHVGHVPPSPQPPSPQPPTPPIVWPADASTPPPPATPPPPPAPGPGGPPRPPSTPLG